MTTARTELNDRYLTFCREPNSQTYDAVGNLLSISRQSSISTLLAVSLAARLFEFSSGIKTASWDSNFVSDADQVFRREVEPTILDIEEEIRSNNFIAQLTRKAVDVPVVVSAGSALALAVTTLGLSGVAALAVGAVVGGGKAAYDAYTEWNEKKRETEQNQLFFYYRAGHLLSEGTHAYLSDATNVGERNQ